jgi:hypothetical protein
MSYTCVYTKIYIPESDSLRIVKGPSISSVEYNPLELWLWCLTPLSKQYSSYIVAVSFIGGGNWSTGKKHRPVAIH